MPISRTRFLRSGALLLVIGLAALIAIVGATFWLAERTQTSFDEVIEARNARAAAGGVRSVLQRAETAQRGYLITGDETYLPQFDEARALFRQRYEELASVLAPYPQTEAPVAELARTIAFKEDEMLRTIAMRREGRTDEAFGVVATNQGRAAMEEADQLFDQVIREADERLTESVRIQTDNATLLRWAAAGAGLVILAVVGGAAWLGLAYTRELLRAEAEIRAMNTGLEARVNERTQDLIRANEEVQRFAYIVTHDLRAPLVNIMGFTSELDTAMKSVQRFFGTDPDARTDPQVTRDAELAAREDLPEAVDFIRSSTRKMDGLINAILKISRDGRRPLKPEPTDLKTLLEANVATLQHQIAEQGGTVDMNVRVAEMISDRLSLEQIIGNLLDNAVKYSSSKRPLRIEVEAVAAGRDRIRIAVRDNGRGIAPEDHQRVFDLFRRAGSQDKPGEGIGLAHVRTLARNLGGDISVQSESDVGSTFTVELPSDLRSFVRSEYA